jgi:hypothetical protein
VGRRARGRRRRARALGPGQRQRRALGALNTAAALLAVFVGAGLGACARWGLSQALNRTGQALPLGTLAANLTG